MTVSKRYVAMCDVLGFKKKVANTPLPGLVQDFEQLQKHTVVLTRVAGSIPHVIFSDTILLWVDAGDTGEDTEYGVFKFFEVLKSLLHSSPESGLPLRVGIAFGECFINPKTQTYLGTPIVDAYIAEESQDWFGGALHPTCHNAPFFSDLCCPLMPDVTLYKVPRHAGRKKDIVLTHALNWAFDAGPDIVTWLLAQESATEDDRTRRKYTRALRFYSHAVSQIHRTLGIGLERA